MDVINFIDIVLISTICHYKFAQLVIIGRTSLLYVHAAYCRRSSVEVVCLSVCRLVCRSRELSKNKKAVLTQETTARCAALVQKACKLHLIFGQRSE